MAGVNRSRSYDKSLSVTGRRVELSSGNVVTGNAVFTDTKTTADVVGNFESANSFSVDSVKRFYRVMDGTAGGYRFELYPWYVYKLPTHGSATVGSTDLNLFANKLLSATNPNTAHISIPTFVGELRELPELVRSFGAKHLRRVMLYGEGTEFAKEAAARHLQYRWGIAPMISDLRKLFDFAKAVDDRMRWLEALSSKGSLRRRRTLDMTTSQTQSSVTMSDGVTCKGTQFERLQTNIWGTVRWVYAGIRPIPKLDKERLKIARALTFGLTPDNILPTAWELMPWSWLVDWFTGFGNFLTAQGNTVPVKPVDICVMKRKTTRSWVQITQSPPAGVRLIGEIGGQFQTKRRQTVASPTPIVFSHLPLLSGDKWSILGSLAIQRLRSR